MLVIAAAAVGLWRKLIAVEFVDARSRWLASLRSPEHPWPLAAVGAGLRFLDRPLPAPGLRLHARGLYAGYVNIWGDWAAHLSFTGSFAYGHNFPTRVPDRPGDITSAIRSWSIFSRPPSYRSAAP